MKYATSVEEGREPSRKCMGLRIRGVVGLGMIVLTGFCLLSGCGSDSTSVGSVKGKNTETATSSKATKMQAATPLLLEKEASVLGNKGRLKEPPEVQGLEVFPGAGITREQMAAKIAAERAKFDPRTMEVARGTGITREQMEAKIAAERAKFDPRTMEVARGTGITWEQMEAKIAAYQAKYASSAKAPGGNQKGSD